jgi:hypothetical protein
MFISAVFTTTKLLKQPKCRSANEWIKKMWYSFTMEFYSVTKKNEILSFASKWMELENIILNEVSQAQEAKKSHVLPHMLIMGLNAVILLDTGHTLRGEHAWEE